MEVTEAEEEGEAQEKRRRTAPDPSNRQEALQRLEKERIEKHQKVHASHHLSHTREDTPAPPKLTTRLLSPQTPTPRHISPHQSHFPPQHPASLTHTHSLLPSPPSHEPKPLPLTKACDEREEVLKNILATDRRNAAVDLFFKVTPPLPPHEATSHCHHFLTHSVTQPIPTQSIHTRPLSQYPLSPHPLGHPAHTHSVHTHSVTQSHYPLSLIPTQSLSPYPLSHSVLIPIQSITHSVTQSIPTQSHTPSPTQSIPTQFLSSYPLSPYPLSHSAPLTTHSVTQSIPTQPIPTQTISSYPSSPYPLKHSVHTHSVHTYSVHTHLATQSILTQPLSPHPLSHFAHTHSGHTHSVHTHLVHTHSVHTYPAHTYSAHTQYQTFPPSSTHT